MWQLPRPIIINGMSDEKYINEITLKGDNYEDNCIASLCKKR